MKRLLRITAMALALAMMLSLSVFSVCTYAAEPLETVLSAGVSITGKKPSPAEDYTIVLEPLDSSNPMPAGSKDGAYKLTITGEGKKSFPEMEFSSVGIYKYKIYQTAGKRADAVYDNTVYTAEVHVFYSDIAEDTLKLSVILRCDKSDKKQDEVLFKNSYKPDKPETGDSVNIAPYIMTGIIAAAVIVIICTVLKKKRTCNH